MTNIIALEKGRYYVGKYTISEIQSGMGPSWVKTYKPVKLIKQIIDKDEDSVLIECMETYGIDYVRGSKYSSMELSSYDRFKINELLFATKQFNNICEYCNMKGHVKSNCDEYKYNNTNDFEQISYKNSSSKKKIDVLNTSDSKSYQCVYCEMNFEDTYILKKHEHTCKDQAFTKSSGKDLNCERCGRNTHATSNCRAKSDIYGYDI